MRVGPNVKLNSVYPRTECIWPHDLHLKLILATVTKLPFSSCRL